MYGSTFVRLACLLGLLAMAGDTEARRAIRVDGTAWGSNTNLGSPDCVGASNLNTLVSFAGHVFAGREHPAHMQTTYCQLTVPGSYTGDANNLFQDASELVLADMVDDNAGNRASAIRYSFLDGTNVFDASGFQWVFYLFPSGGTIAGLYGLELPYAFDHNSYIRQGDARIWDGGRDDYAGEFFCFEDEQFLGTWDGTLDDPSPCLLIGYRLFRGDFE